MLRSNAIRTQERRGHVSKANEQDVHIKIGRNVQVYVDDMSVKCIREDDLLDDLKETFDTFRPYNMKLNPSKCAFGVMAGKFLGFMVFQRGIEVNLDKIQAIMELTPPKNVKEV